MTAEESPLSLVALRTLNTPFYVDLMRALYVDDVARAAATSAITDLAAKHSSEGDDGLPDLTALLASSEYRSFVQFLNLSAPDAADKVQRILESKEYELRLARLKARSLVHYVNELRVVSEEELVSALRGGTIVNAIDDDGQPMPIRSDENSSGAFLDQPTATAWLDAELLTAVLNRFAQAGDEYVADPQGLRLRHVVVGQAQVNLNWLDCPFPLGFEGCDFYYSISADYMTVPWLSFDSCDFTPHGHRMAGDGAFNAQSIVVEHDLRFWGCRGLGQLFIPDARIGSFSPTNPDSTDQSGALLPEVKEFRTVIDGATFGQFYIPNDPDDEFQFTVSRSVRMDVLGGLPEDAPAVAEQVFTWLRRNEERSHTTLPRDVWDQFEGALRRSNHSDAATQFGILAARYQTTKEGGKGLLKRAVLGPTVQYFYNNMRALWFLLALFVVAWGAVLGMALFAPEQLVQSPLANEAVVPDLWLVTVADKLVWSFLYAIDLVMSPISLGLAATIWPVSIWFSLLFALIKGLSLLFLGLFVVGVTGLAERRAHP